MAYLDLEELPELLGGRLASSRPGVVRFRRSDYLGDRGEDLASAVRERVASLSGLEPAGPVRLLTNLRTFGHCFNPVIIYFCFDRSAERVDGDGGKPVIRPHAIQCAAEIACGIRERAVEIEQDHVGG